MIKKQGTGDTAAERHVDTSPLHRFSDSLICFKKVTILGVGLIGASFALAMKKYKLCDHITGNGRSLENLQKAKEMKIIDSFELDPAKACNDSDLIIFATPVGSFLEIAKKVRSSFKKSAKDARDKVVYIWKTFGSIVELVNPEEHDRIYAAVSHLPHIIAYAIVNTVGDLDSSYLKFAGQGFIGATRIASSSPELWRDIWILNKENLLQTIEIFKNNLERLSQYLRASDVKSLEKEFKKARTLREGIGPKCTQH